MLPYDRNWPFQWFQLWFWPLKFTVGGCELAVILWRIPALWNMFSCKIGSFCVPEFGVPTSWGDRSSVALATLASLLRLHRQLGWHQFPSEDLWPKRFILFSSSAPSFSCNKRVRRVLFALIAIHGWTSTKAILRWNFRFWSWRRGWLYVLKPKTSASCWVRFFPPPTHDLCNSSRAPSTPPKPLRNVQNFYFFGFHRIFTIVSLLWWALEFILTPIFLADPNSQILMLEKCIYLRFVSNHMINRALLASQTERMFAKWINLKLVSITYTTTPPDNITQDTTTSTKCSVNYISNLCDVVRPTRNDFTLWSLYEFNKLYIVEQIYHLLSYASLYQTHRLCK